MSPFSPFPFVSKSQAVAEGDSRGIDVFVLGSSVMSPAALSCVYDTLGTTRYPQKSTELFSCLLVAPLTFRDEVLRFEIGGFTCFTKVEVSFCQTHPANSFDY